MQLIINGSKELYQDDKNAFRYDYVLLDKNGNKIEGSSHMKGDRACREISDLLIKFLNQSDSPTIEVSGQSVGYCPYLTPISSLVRIYNAAVKVKRQSS